MQWRRKPFDTQTFASLAFAAETHITLTATLDDKSKNSVGV